MNGLGVFFFIYPLYLGQTDLDVDVVISGTDVIFSGSLSCCMLYFVCCDRSVYMFLLCRIKAVASFYFTDGTVHDLLYVHL